MGPRDKVTSDGRGPQPGNQSCLVIYLDLSDAGVAELMRSGKYPDTVSGCRMCICRRQDIAKLADANCSVIIPVARYLRGEHSIHKGYYKLQAVAEHFNISKKLLNKWRVNENVRAIPNNDAPDSRRTHWYLKLSEVVRMIKSEKRIAESGMRIRAKGG